MIKYNVKDDYFIKYFLVVFGELNTNISTMIMNSLLKLIRGIEISFMKVKFREMHGNNFRDLSSGFNN